MKFNDLNSQMSNISNKKLPAESVYSFLPKIKEPKLLDDWVLWLEQRPKEGGRTTALISPWWDSTSFTQELTPAPFNLRSRIHGYGGAALAVGNLHDQLILVWVDDMNGCLWTQSWKGLQNLKGKKESYLKAINKPICISKTGNFCLGDGLIDVKRMQWVGLMEKDEEDFIVTFSLLEELQEPNIIYKAKDFLGYLKLSPNGSRLAWVEWQKSHMPWEKSQIWTGILSEIGRLKVYNFVAGSKSKSKKDISVFQPIWLGENKLLFSDDTNGWWNLYTVDFFVERIDINKREYVWEINAELAYPQWVAGMSCISGSDEQVVALSCDKSIWNLNLIIPNYEIKKIDIPFDDLAYLDAQKGKAIVIASNSYDVPSLLEVDLISGKYNQKSKEQDLSLIKEEISVGESFWFKGFDDCMTQAWYYPPCPIRSEKIPLLVKIHSGPTSMSSRGLNLAIQFWTSRGWGVLEVNYGGSTGFGKSYRNRLQKGWGEVDVFDCCAAANSLIDLGKVHKDYVAIEGSSAGGFTALSCLAKSKTFRVASCKYPVTDLCSMANNTHRFEAHYLDYLVGPFVDNYNQYFERSPINNIAKINSPIIFFHGLKDNVVDIDQVQRIHASLKNNGIPVEFHVFENEGHGFRNRDINIKVLELTEQFFNNHLGIFL